MKVRVVRFNEQAAHDAFEAHAAMAKIEALNPALARNEYWRALRDTARARFFSTFEAL